MLATNKKMKDHGLQRISILIYSLLLLYSPIISGELQDSCLEGKIVPCRNDYNASSLRFLDPNPQLHISVVRGKYLSPSLSCKAEGFTNITWLKDDRFEFPFGFEPGSTLCYVHLKDCNQTVEITDTQKDAIGNYTCLVSNGRQTIQRTFTLNVEDEDFTDDPYTIDHDNCSDVGVERGQDIFIFCEFCAEVRAQQTDVRWYKLDEDKDLVPINQLIGEGGDEEESRYWESANIHTRDCLKTYNLPAAIGRKLIIRDVTPNEFGRYVIIANYTLDGESKEGRIDITVSRAPYVIIEITVGIMVSLTVTFLLVTMVTLLCRRYHLTLQLYWKNRFGKIEEHDGMEHDAFISFSDSLEDTRFAISLAQLLLEKGYDVWMRDMHAIPGEALIAEEIVSMKRSRRCILIISPDYPMSSHSEVLTDLAADQTLRKQSRIIPILYRDVNKEHLKPYRRLAEIVRVCPCIVWKATGESLETQPSSDIGGKGIEDGGGTSDLEEISSDHVGELGRDCSNGFGSGTAGITGDSNLANGDDHKSVGSNQSRETGDSHITSTNNSDIGMLDYHSKNDMRMTPKDGDLDHNDVGTVACRSDHGMKKSHRDGDLDQLIDDQEDEDSKKRKIKWKKQKEGYEKKLLLKMPPKRAVAKPDGNEAPTIV